MKINTLFILGIFCCMAWSAWGQNTSVSVLQKQTKEGTVPQKVAAHNQLTNYYYHADVQKSNENNQAALRLLPSDTIALASVAYCWKARLDYSQGKYDGAIEHAIKAIQIGHSYAKDPLLLAEAYACIGLVYSSKGYAHKAIDYIIKALKITENAKDVTIHVKAYHTIAKAYLNLDNADQSIRFLNKTLELRSNKKTNVSPLVFLDLGAAELELDQLEDAKQNINLGLDLCQKSGNRRGLAYAYMLLGQLELWQENIDKSIDYYNKSIVLYTKLQDAIGRVEALRGLSQLSFEQKKYKKATVQLEQALSIAKTSRANTMTKKLYKDLSDIMLANGEYEQSLTYYRKYSIVKDSIINREKNREIAELQIKHNAQVLEKEKEELIEKTKNQALQIELRNKELNIQQLKNNQNFYVILGLGSFLALAAIITGLLWRQNNLQTQIRETELEQRALRSQMNPHFMFNSLNSIQSLIAIGDNSAASIYLAKFARLMRRILQNSRETYIPMQQEIDFLNNYIELEQRRFKEAFSFEVDTEGVEDAHFVMIPPLVIQPFIENAIIHGLLRKSEKGTLTVKFEDYDSDFVKCIVKDNGIGRTAAAEFKTDKKHESLGLKITEQRLRYLTIKNKNKPRLTHVIDLKDENGEAAGTAVEILLPIKYKA